MHAGIQEFLIVIPYGSFMYYSFRFFLCICPQMQIVVLLALMIFLSSVEVCSVFNVMPFTLFFEPVC